MALAGARHDAGRCWPGFPRSGSANTHPLTCSTAAVPLRAKMCAGGLGIWKNTVTAQIHFRSPKGSELTHCITSNAMNF